jgi:hypothetical protein
MNETIQLPADSSTEQEETAQPIVIRMLDRLETTSFNSQGAS